MTRWASYIPGGWLNSAQMLEAIEKAARLAGPMVPLEVAEFVSSTWSNLRAADTADPKLQMAVVATICATAITAFLARRLLRPSRSVLDVLETDPDFTCFHGYWLSLPTGGPWEKPDLGKPRPKADDAASAKLLVAFVPVNKAWEKARQDIFPYSKEVWRKFLIGHVAEIDAEQVPLLHSRANLDSLSGRRISLDCIRDFYSDGSFAIRTPVVADNGLIYKIDRVLTIAEAAAPAAGSHSFLHTPEMLSALNRSQGPIVTATGA